MPRRPPRARRTPRSKRTSTTPPFFRTAWIVAAAAAVALALVIGVLRLRDSRPVFDGARAHAHLVRQVAFGPRVPGSAAHDQTRAYLVEQLRPYADRLFEQSFTHTDRRDTTRRYTGTNIVASFNLTPKTNRRILLAAHWDTRPVADRDPNPANRTRPVPGANDGASGVAVLLEMARLLHAEPPDVGVDLVLFDLEDLGDESAGDSAGAGNPFALGSAYFAASNPDYRPEFGIVVDMVGDRNLRIPKEAYSVANAPAVVERVWAAAKKVGATAFREEPGMAVYDDHIAFLQRGIPVIDLIHTPFPASWHTLQDTPEQTSPASLEQVGRVLVEVVYGE